jgi:hypothetical protein
MKKTIKGYAMGFLSAILLFTLATGVYAAANARTRTMTVTYGHIRLVVNGEQITPRDGQGNVVHPFVSDGTTYLPVRALADALGQEVRWDGATSTVYIDSPTQAVQPVPTPQPTPVPTPPLAPVVREVEVPLFNQPCIRVGDSNFFNASADSIRVMVNAWEGERLADNRTRHTNYVVYTLGDTATRFTATLNPPVGSGIAELVYSIYGDGRNLFTSPIMTQAVSPQLVDIDVAGVSELRIEVVLIGDPQSINSSGYLGIENATVVTIVVE